MIARDPGKHSVLCLMQLTLATEIGARALAEKAPRICVNNEACAINAALATGTFAS
jgi:hypothetical protein